MERTNKDPGFEAGSAGPSTLEFLANDLRDRTRLNLRIHAEDEMFLRELAEAGGDQDLASWRYLRTGESIARAVEQLADWRFGGFANLTSFLDFACGYGRVTRFLATRMLADRIWISDIYPGAVSFLQHELGVNGFASVTDPGNLRVDRTFDCILAVSLFSHLPAELFEAWLAKLTDMLAKSGMLIFSAHDSSLLPPHLALNDSGFCFGEESESRTLSKRSYGTMYVSEAFVRKQVNPAHGLLRIPRAFGSFQDVYLLSKDGFSGLGPLHYIYGPIGAVESVEIRGQQLRVQGRAADLTEGSQVLISVSLNGKVIGTAPPRIPRPDVAKWTGFPNSLVSGFSLTMNLPSEYSEDDLLLVRATSSQSSFGYVLHIGGVGDATRRFAPAGSEAPIANGVGRKLRRWIKRKLA